MNPIAMATASALVRAMTTDAWQQVQAAMVALWRRAVPEQAEAIEDALADTRALVLNSHDSGHEAAEADLVAEWHGRICRLLVTEPALADELRHILEVALGALPPGEQARIVPTNQTIEVTASGHIRIYQAGRDQHVANSERDGSTVGNTPPGPPLGDDDDEW
ncbi:hypothetical protein [Streptomyces sp. NPDC054771]